MSRGFLTDTKDAPLTSSRLSKIVALWRVICHPPESWNQAGDSGLLFQLILSSPYEIVARLANSSSGRLADVNLGYRPWERDTLTFKELPVWGLLKCQHIFYHRLYGRTRVPAYQHCTAKQPHISCDITSPGNYRTATSTVPFSLVSLGAGIPPARQPRG